jgi:hypothetical protein
MIACTLAYLAPTEDLPGVVEGFAYALGIDSDQALDILTDAGEVPNEVVLQMTDAAFGRLTANCNLTRVGDATEILAAACDGFDMAVEVLYSEPDQDLIAAHVVNRFPC